MPNKYELTPPQMQEVITMVDSGRSIYAANGLEYECKPLGPDVIYVQALENGKPLSWETGIVRSTLPKLLKEWEKARSKADKSVTVRLPSWMLDEVTLYCKTHGTNISELVRDCLGNLLQNGNK